LACSIFKIFSLDSYVLCINVIIFEVEIEINLGAGKNATTHFIFVRTKYART